MPYFIYILKLVEGKYYVGLTKDLYIRLEQHFHKRGSKWTTLYEPISVERVIESDSCFDEDKWTKIMMEKHGIKNVRGGSYTSIVLSTEEEKLLERQERTRNQACFICGIKGHFGKRCPLNFQQRKRLQPAGLQSIPKRKERNIFVRENPQSQQVRFNRQGKESFLQIPMTQIIKVQSQGDEDELFDQLQSIRSKPSKILKKDTNITDSHSKVPISKPKEPSQ